MDTYATQDSSGALNDCCSFVALPKLAGKWQLIMPAFGLRHFKSREALFSLWILLSFVDLTAFLFWLLISALSA